MKMELTVATYNILHGEMTDMKYEILAKDILDSDASIVGIQEVDLNTLRNYNQDTLALLSKHTGWDYYAYAPTLTNFLGGQYGIAVLSKYPILSARHEGLPAVTESEEPRTVLHTVIDVNGYALDFFATHNDGGSIVEQLAAIQKQTSLCKSYVLVGDFNCEDYERFRVFSDATPVNNASNPLPTTMGDASSIDNILYSSNIKCLGCHTIDTKHTDHYMLVADLVLPEK